MRRSFPIIGDYKVCTACLQNKHVTNYTKVQLKSGEWSVKAACKPCTVIAGRQSLARHKDTRDRYIRAYKAKNRERLNAEQLTRTRTAREKMAGRPQPICCEICDKNSNKPLHFDHDHETNKFRGWLCDRCNLVLGMVGDNTELLAKLCQYLQDNQDNDGPQLVFSPCGVLAGISRQELQ